MKTAVFGTGKILVGQLSAALPKQTTELIIGGILTAKGKIKAFAIKRNIPFSEFFPNYQRYAWLASYILIEKIIELSDYVLVFWDGKSRVAQYAISYAEILRKPVRVVSVLQ